jgi:hypothetical protein
MFVFGRGMLLLTRVRQGRRSVTMVTAMTQYSSNIGYRAIAQAVNDNVLIMPMIETREGVENVEWVELVSSLLLSRSRRFRLTRRDFLVLFSPVPSLP